MEQHFQMFAWYNRWANELLYAAAADLSDEEYRLDLGLFSARSIARSTIFWLRTASG